MGFLTGGSDSKSKLPDWYTDWMKRALQYSDVASQIGYTPYMGPDVAAFTPQQKAAWSSANDWSKAFGGPTADISEPDKQTYAGGIQGYSSYPGYKETMDKFSQAYPGQAAMIKAFSANPQTGALSQVSQKLDKRANEWGGLPFYQGQPPWYQAAPPDPNNPNPPPPPPPPNNPPPVNRPPTYRPYNPIDDWRSRLKGGINWTGHESK